MEQACGGQPSSGPAPPRPLGSCAPGCARRARREVPRQRSAAASTAATVRAAVAQVSRHRPARALRSSPRVPAVPCRLPGGTELSRRGLLYLTASSRLRASALGALGPSRCAPGECGVGNTVPYAPIPGGLSSADPTTDDLSFAVATRHVLGGAGPVVGRAGVQEGRGHWAVSRPVSTGVAAEGLLHFVGCSDAGPVLWILWVFCADSLPHCPLFLRNCCFSG